MDWVTVIWSAMAGACLMLALMHLVIWFRDRSLRANLWFCVAVAGVVGLMACELVTMHAKTPEEYIRGLRYAHVVNLFNTAGILGFVHFHFGTGRRGLLWLVVALRVAALVANFTTGGSLHASEVHSLAHMEFLGETVSILGEWEPNRWVLLGQSASLVLVIYILDASLRLWRKGTREAGLRAAAVGGSLVFFITAGALQAGLVAAGVLKMPFFVSLPFLGMIVAVGGELSREVLRVNRLFQKMKRSEQQLTLAAAAGNMSLWEWDIAADRIWVNGAGRMLYGVDRKEKIDFERFVSTVHHADQAGMRGAVEAALAGPDRYAADYRVDLPDGSVRWMAARGMVERDEQGRPFLLRGVSMDITERKQAERESARQQQELAHLSRISILGELAGALAHELNQPLAAILGNAQVGRGSLGMESPDFTEMAAILDDITDDAKRAGGVIHGMRAMFKKDSVAEPMPMDLNEAVTQVLHLLHSEIVGSKVSLETSLAAGLPPVSASRVEVQQVLINLVMNALDAMKGIAQVRCLEIATALAGDRIQVTVRDRGPGIAEDMMERLFEPFCSSKNGGLGLGLAISRSIALRFLGGLDGGNHPDGGAVFTLSLPLAGSGD